MKRLFPVILMCVLLVSAIPAFADITVGLPAQANNGNCLPFGGCLGIVEYQQDYSSSLFTGPITITNLEFFNTEFNSGATAMTPGNWQIYLSTTSVAYNGLSTTLANNIGSDNTLVFSGSLAQAWTFPDILVIDLSTPFTYNPSNGNLLMDVVWSGTTASFTSNYFDESADGSAMGRAYHYGSNFATDTASLVTEFSTGTTPTPAPEPASMLLLGLGLVGLAGVRRKFKN